MFGITFGHGTIKKYVIYFGTLFNNIHLNRYDNNGTLIQNMKVPLNYGPREKFLARVDSNPDLDRPIAIQLPRMSFEMTNIYYDTARKGQTLNKITAVNPNDPDKKFWQYAPVPYNIEFQLSIMVKNAEDGTYIIEQILPYFTPEWTATLKINPELDIKYDVPLTLDNINSEDTYEGSFTERRALIWTLNFSMKGWLFGPTKGLDGSGSIIKHIDINLLIPPAGVAVDDASRQNTDPSVEILITPGLDGNNDPLNWYGEANTANPPRPTSVAANTINSDDNYGFIIDFTENL